MKRFLRIVGACAIGLLLVLVIFTFLKPLDYARIAIPGAGPPNACLGSGPETSVVARQINFHVVVPGVWRSAAPNEESLFRMKQHGLKTLVDLRQDGEQGVDDVQAIAKRFRFQYFHFPLNAFDEQNLNKLDQILAVIEASGGHPVLFHCAAGKDRTGMITALFKIKHTREKFTDIYQEMVMLGYDHARLPLVMKSIRRWCETHGYPEIAAQISPDGSEVFKNAEH